MRKTVCNKTEETEVKSVPKRKKMKVIKAVPLKSKDRSSEKTAIEDEVDALLKRATDVTARLVCSIADDPELFVGDSPSVKDKADLKSLKDYASLLKELGALVHEVFDTNRAPDGIHIVFDDEIDKIAN